jgi:hypothetical protein
MQVLTLTQAQIDSLPPTERDQIYQLVECARQLWRCTALTTPRGDLQRKQFGVPMPGS